MRCSLVFKGRSGHSRRAGRGNKGNLSHPQSDAESLISWIKTGDEASIEISERACAGTSGVAAGAACAHGTRRTSGTLRGDGKDTKLRAQLLALTLRALGLVAAEDQGFKLVLAFLADVLENRHEDRSRRSGCCY